MEMGTGDRGFGHRVAKMRLKQGISRKDLARLVPGFTRERVMMIEVNQLDASDLTSQQHRSLAEVLECPLTWLLHGEETTVAEIAPGSLALRLSGERLATQRVLNLSGPACPDCG